LPPGPDMAGVVRVRDVTDRMNTLRDMRSFNASVTHKLLTPLVHVVGNLDLLAKYYRNEVANPDIAELFEMAYSGGRRLHKEIDQIIQYTRNLPLLATRKDAFDMADVAALATTVGNELGLPPVSITYEGCPLSARIVLPRRAMALIISELLENARKFHPQQMPQVEVMVSCDDTNSVKLLVMDDGRTLSPEQLAQVWTPYYQAEKHFTGEVAGLGLGLTMISTLVWGVGGDCVLANRTPPPGVIVELTLPRA
ncbi:MAG: HAMP domain-containing histidine kinase, partial [Anaerolineae bacterium]|nr:HAMP domain-containing histidine kinase [Anaerolineae bacterium]